MDEVISLNRITTEIASQLEREFDEPFKRVLADKVDAWRSRLIRNSLQTKPNESKFFRQSIYIPMRRGTLLSPCIDLEICQSAISILDIPVPLRFRPSLFDYVGSVDGHNPFYEAAGGTMSYLSAGKYSKDVVYYGYVNNKFEVFNAPNLPAMRVDGVFDKPSAVMAFNCSNSGIGCDYWDAPYPMTGDIKQMVVQSILQIDFPRPDSVPETKEVEVNKEPE